MSHFRRKFRRPSPVAGIEALAPRFPTPFTPVYRCSKYTPKPPFLPFFGAFGAASGRDGSLGKTLQHHEIGHDRCSAGPSQNRVGIGAPKLPHQFPLIVHYLNWLTMAPDPHSLALRSLTRFQPSIRHRAAAWYSLVIPEMRIRFNRPNVISNAQRAN